MDRYQDLVIQTERIVHKYNQSEKKQRKYGTDQLFSRVEIHTIAAIGDYPDMNITKLAAYQGITKGAASQMIYKLVDRGAVVKSISPDSDSEVRLSLTEFGRKAYQGHQMFHHSHSKKLSELINQMPEESYQALLHLTKCFEVMLDESLQEKGE